MFLIFDHLAEIKINYKHSEIQKFKFWMVLLPRAWTLAYASNENVFQNHTVLDPILAGTFAKSLDPGLYRLKTS